MTSDSANWPQRLLVFNLAMDLDHSMLAFAHGWVAALARRVDSVDVVTMTAGRVDPPANVRIHSVGKERGYSELRRLGEFYKLLVRILATSGIDACFSHMMPLFTALGAPILRSHRVPIVTWYAHPRTTLMLRLAHKASIRMVSSLATAYPYRHDKLTVIGQGIDTDLFAPDGSIPTAPPTILCAGRIAPVKDHSTLLRAVATLRERMPSPFHVVLVGEAASTDGRRYADSLLALARHLRIDDVVRFEHHVDRSHLPRWYRRATVHVNLTRTGFGDKVAWESMSCGRPCVAANEGFQETFGRYARHLLFPYGDWHALAERLSWILSLPPDEREEMGRFLRAQVERLHSLDRLADRVLGVFRETGTTSGRRAWTDADR